MELDQSVHEVKEFQKMLNHAVKDVPGVKENITTEEEEKNTPAYDILKHITDTSIEILSSSSYRECFALLASKLGRDGAKRLFDMVAVAMTQSAYSAILYYDNFIQEQIEKQMNLFSEGMNNMNATLNGHTGAIQVLQAKVGELEKSSKLHTVLNNQ